MSPKARAPEAPFTLAQLADVHLAPLPHAGLTSLNVKQLLGLANWRRTRHRHHLRAVLDALVADMRAQRPDHIAVTGDLVNLGLPSEQEAALAWLRALGPPGTVTAIPGNHDVYGHSSADPGIERWRPYMRGAAGETDFPFVKTIGRIALIGASSAVPTPPFYATGRVGPGQMERLAGVLKDLGRRGLVRVLLIHHPPLFAQADRFRRLTDAEVLETVLEESGAELVLHGHNHRPMAARLNGPDGPIPIIGAPSASAAPGHHEPAAGYNLIRFDAGRIHLTRRAMAADGRFATVEERELGAN